MSSRIRFADAADVFDAFAGLQQYAAKAPGVTPPLDYARRLSGSRRPFEALVFLAHLLPRREAIWWGCQCVAAVSRQEEEGWRLAERWVRNPDDALRREALAHSLEPRSPGAWLARAVGHSGGSLAAPDQPPSPPAPEASGMAVNAAIVLAIVAEPEERIHPWIRSCADAGIRFAEGEDIRVAPPVARKKTA